MKILRFITLFTFLCLLLLSCKEREPLNPLDPDNPNTNGQAYTIKATASGIGRVKVHWKKVNQSQIKGYRLYYSAEGATSSLIAEINDTLYLNSGLLPGKTYNYFYKLIWEDGREIHQSPTTNVVTFNAPSGLTVGNATRNRVEIYWNKLEWLDNYAYCRIYRNSGGTFSLYDSTSSNLYYDMHVDTGITYRYKVAAVATDGNQSNLSDEGFATPGNNPPVIDSLKASQPFTNWGEEVTITCYAHDEDGDPITYSWEALDGGIIVVSGQTIAFRVPQDTNLNHRVKVTVTDGYSATNSSIIMINSENGLVAYYPFNGNANDESVNNNNGTIHSATLTSDRFVNSNSAYNFDGKNSYIIVHDNPTLNFGKGDFSLSAWFKINELLDPVWGNQILCKLEHNGGSYEIQVNYDRKFYMWTGEAGSSVVIGSSNLINLGIWYHAVGVRKGSVLNIYINNIKQIGSVISDKNINNSSDLYIGKDSYLPEYINGSIDDIRIYNRALTESEIQQLYHEGGW